MIPLRSKVRLVEHGDAGTVGVIEAWMPHKTDGVRIFIRWPNGGGMWVARDGIEVQP